MKSAFLWKILAIVLVAVILSAALTMLVFNYSGRIVFSRYKANELLPRAQYLSSVTAEYIQGYMGARDYERAVAGEYYIWDASVYIYNADGELFVSTNNADMESNTSAISEYIDAVLGGSKLYYPATHENSGVIIGEPVISRYRNVIGAVFLVKPIRELNTALQGLNLALMISMTGAALLMLLPAYFVSKRTTDPLRQMTDAAAAMARGDFSVRAHDTGSDEVAVLGRALNHLSSELSSTIGDLTLERNRLTAIMDGLREGIVAFDGSMSVIRCNPAAIRLLGGGDGDADADISELIGKYGLYDMAGGHKDGVTERDFAVNDMTVHAALTVLYEKSGGMEGYVLLLRDVTEAVRLEQTRRDYVANVSHELRTPIASIRGLADALNDGMVRDDLDKARYYGYILHEAMRLSRLIDDLLELSRLQSGTRTIEKRRADLRELVCDVADRFTETAAAEGRSVIVSLPDGELPALMNPDRVEEVLVILMDNAISHASGEDDIRASVSPGGAGEWLLCVQNPGSIAERDIEHVFERFYKADKSHSGNGTGLGLSIASELISAMGERIWARSEGGTVSFTLTLSRTDGENKEML